MKPALIESVEYTRKLEVENFYSIAIEPSNTSAMIKMLTKKFVFPSQFSHVKRIKRTPEGLNLMLVCTVSQSTPESIISLLELTMPCVQISSVSRHKAFTRAQFDEWNLSWPISFNGTTKKAALNEMQLIQFEKYMTMVIDISEKFPVTDNVCIIVEPVTGVIYAKTTVSEADFHPLHHPIIRCLNEIAFAEQKRRLDINPMKRQLEKCLIKLNYLCTDLDLYIYNEPCYMCAMSLVHSRIKRVFFLKSGMEKLACAHNCSGDAFTNGGVHYHPNLNHHFDVYITKL